MLTTMTPARHLDWSGCFNVRDLGGLSAGTRRTRRGAVIRADDVSLLTSAGWQALRAHGIRTVIDLRNPDEITADRSPRPDELTTVNVPIDDVHDTELWSYIQDHELDGTPLYYQPFLDRKPGCCAAAIAAVADARPGGVVIHCSMGRDRTGLVSLLLLALAGVDPEHIIADYAASAERLPARYSALGLDDQNALITDVLKRKNTSIRELLVDLLAGLAVDTYLKKGGIGDAELRAVRTRLLETPG